MRLDEESGTATEDEEDLRARELRKQEVWLMVPPRNSDTDTGSETEVKHSQESTVQHIDAKVSTPDITGDDLDDLVIALDSSVDATINLQQTTVPIVIQVSDDKENLNDLDIEHSELNIDANNTIVAIEGKNLKEVQHASTASIGSLTHFGIEYVDLDSISSDSRIQAALPKAISNTIIIEKTIAKQSEKNGTSDLFQVNQDNLPDLIASSPQHGRREQEICIAPVVSITAMTPTIEEKPKLQSLHHESQDAYNNLKQELASRRAKKREGLAELRPLSRETARSKVNEYFAAMKTIGKNRKSVDDKEIYKISQDSIVPLDVKSQVSDKVETKDLMKYFVRKSEQECETSKIPQESSVVLEKLCDFVQRFRDVEDTNESLENTNGVTAKLKAEEEVAVCTRKDPLSIEKFTIVAKEIVQPAVAIPKRVECKRHSQESPSNETKETSPTCNLTLEIPRRRKPESTILLASRDTEQSKELDESLCEEILIAKESQESKPSGFSSRNRKNESKRHLNPLKSLSLKPEVHGSNKSVASSKFYKINKKDKCTIS